MFQDGLVAPALAPVLLITKKKNAMKKLLVISLVLLSGSAYSQGLLGRLSFGLKAGTNYSNFTNANFSTSGLLGYHAGAIINFKLIAGLSFQEEFLFSTQGAKVQTDQFSQFSQFNQDNLKIYYMTVPLLLKYRTPWGIYVEGGGQVGFRIKEDVGNQSVTNFAKKMDLAGVGGLGYQMKCGLGFGARYVAGISKVGDFNSSSISPDFKNAVVQGSVFFIF
jgi:Outer membrane protein beta-barrel domain